MVLVRLYGFLLNLSIQSLQHKLASNNIAQLSALAQERRTRTKISPVFLDTGSFGRRSFQFFIEFCFLFSATESDTVHHIFDCLKWLFRIDSAFCELLSLCLFRIFFWTQLRSSSWRWQSLNCENNCHGWTAVAKNAVKEGEAEATPKTLSCVMFV